MGFSPFVPQMWDRLRRFRRWPRPARLMFLRAAVLLPLISLSLRVRGFAATQKWLRAARPEARANNEKKVSNIAAAERAVRAAARYGLVRATCLERALAQRWLLGKEGVSAELRIGVRKTGEKFEAHAWVECAGQALDAGDSHQHYAAFDAELSRLATEKAP